MDLRWLLTDDCCNVGCDSAHVAGSAVTTSEAGSRSEGDEMQYNVELKRMRWHEGASDGGEEVQDTRSPCEGLPVSALYDVQGDSREKPDSIDAQPLPSRQPSATENSAESEAMDRIVEVSRKDQMRFSCNICGRFFRVKRDLHHHVSCVHEQVRPFACKLCPSKFSIRPNLSRHVRTVHEKERPFKCKMCDRHFGLKENLEKHVRLVHEKQRPFTCEYCGNAFGIMSTLKRHIARNHQGAGSKT